MYNTFIGIDPGKAGCMAVIHHGRTTIYPTPCKPDYDIWKMHMNIKEHAHTKTFAILERAQAMPGQGVVSMFEFGKGYGIWLALLNVNYVSYQVVHSRVWTREMLAGAPGDGKERAYLVARKLFPKWNPKYEYEHQYADAMLLASFAERIQRAKEIIKEKRDDGRTEGNSLQQ